MRAALLLGCVRVALALLPFQAVRRLVGKLSQQPGGARRPQPDDVQDVIWAVETASRYMPGDVTCLRRALAAQILLARRGHRAALRIGVVVEADGQLKAHAWVEHQGEIVVGRIADLARYTPLPALEANQDKRAERGW